MTFKKLSSKQKLIFKWCHKTNNPYKAIICDGAVRSGKTVCMITSFLLWAMKSFDGASFGICGKTVRSAERNIIVPLQQIVDITSCFKLKYTRSVNLLTVEGMGKTNYFYVFGGKDESSYMLIQGITLSGVLFDEVALMPESFVSQAIARTLSVRNALLWFNCNPENPNHYFYKEWVCKAEEKEALHLHFLMDDNPTLSQDQLDAAKKRFTGVFYDRYIRGLWVFADGLVYQQFADDSSRWIVDKADKDIQYVTVGIDFGGNRSLTTFVATAVHYGYKKLTVLKDYHIDGRKGEIDADRVNREFIAFVKVIEAEYPQAPVRYAFADNEAQYLVNGLRKACKAAGLAVIVEDAAKNEIVQRIYCTQTLLNLNRLFILRDCKLLIGGLQGALWDKKAAEKGEDKRLDNFSSDIDILDAFEYSFERFMRKLLPEGMKN